MSSKIYLDYAAATPLSDLVLEEMLATKIYYANPSSSHSAGQEARNVLRQQKQRIANILGAKLQNIILTSSGTEADNLAIRGLSLQDNDNPIVITTRAEHKASSRSITDKGWEIVYLEIDDQGQIDQLGFERVLGLGRPTLIAIGMISIEVGLIRDLKKIKQIIKLERARRQAEKIDQEIYWHCDGSGAGGLLPYRVEAIGADSLSINAAKIYGPKGVGALYVSDHLRTNLKPLIIGGGQQGDLRSGTESIFLATGLASALELADQIRKQEVARLAELKNLFWEQLNLENLDTKVIMNSLGRYYLTNYIHLSIPGKNGLELASQLDARGLIVSTSSACDASDQEYSPVLLALGFEPDTAKSSLRVTLGRSTNDDDIIKLVMALKEII